MEKFQNIRYLSYIRQGRASKLAINVHEVEKYTFVVDFNFLNMYS